jgi:hypothetical protein
MDTMQEEYGTERMVQCVATAADKKAMDIVSTLSSDVAQFSRHGTHIDDKVMIVIKVV